MQLGGMLDEASLELFESQSHLLDPDSLAALQARTPRLAQRAAAGGVAGCVGHLLCCTQPAAARDRVKQPASLCAAWVAAAPAPS